MEFDGATVLGLHTARMRDMVLAMKHPSRRDLALYFGRRLAERVADLSPTVITAVPMTWWEFVLHGYNPAAEVAEQVAERLGRPFDEHVLRKIRTTRKQKELPLSVRVRNPVGAFHVFDRDRVRGQRVLLIDDVLTTGATLSACSAPLRQAGAASVWAAVVSRG